MENRHSWIWTISISVIIYDIVEIYTAEGTHFRLQTNRRVMFPLLFCAHTYYVGMKAGILDWVLIGWEGTNLWSTLQVHPSDTGLWAGQEGGFYCVQPACKLRTRILSTHFGQHAHIQWVLYSYSPNPKTDIWCKRSDNQVFPNYKMRNSYSFMTNVNLLKFKF